MRKLKILIITRTIFPLKSPRSYRATELAKEFANQGHDVILYAVLGNYNYSEFNRSNNLKVKSIRKMRFATFNSDGKRRYNYFDRFFSRFFLKYLDYPNIEFMFKINTIINQEKDIDLLITIASPHAIHWGASLAKLKNRNIFPKKWVADCGDPFMGNKFQNHAVYFKYIEKWFSKNCNFITIPFEGAKKGYYKEFYNKIRIIPQGFKFDKTSISNKFVPNKVPIFVYAGTFYKMFRNPILFIEYINSLNIDFKFIVYTKSKTYLEPYKELLGSKLEVYDYILREDLLRVLAKADFLLNFENETENQLPSKLIDYALSGRPILSIKPDILEKYKINSFLKGNYESQLVIENIEQYKIENVANKFINLYYKG